MLDKRLLQKRRKILNFKKKVGSRMDQFTKEHEEAKALGAGPCISVFIKPDGNIGMKTNVGADQAILALGMLDAAKFIYARLGNMVGGPAPIQQSPILAAPSEALEQLQKTIRE